MPIPPSVYNTDWGYTLPARPVGSQFLVRSRERNQDNCDIQINFFTLIDVIDTPQPDAPADLTVCEFDTKEVTYTITGVAGPFDLTFDADQGVGTFTILGYNSGTPIDLDVDVPTPPPVGVTTTYTLNSIVTPSPALCDNPGPGLDVFTVTVVADLDAGLVGPTGNIPFDIIGFLCEGDDPALIPEFTAPTGGTGVYTFQWQEALSHGFVYNDIP